ncbi:IS1 family transposase [Photorhabdus luminescens]|uniref:IS1 family transposase n=2 Tax=Morganellaceae TaxID=1903414 RepID=UPI000944291C
MGINQIQVLDDSWSGNAPRFYGEMMMVLLRDNCNIVLWFLSQLSISLWEGELCQRNWSQKSTFGRKNFYLCIKRYNLNRRTYIKKLAIRTICYSRPMEIHEKPIGAYIERHHKIYPMYNLGVSPQKIT